MTPETVFRNEIRTVGEFLPGRLPEARIGILRGVWQTWQKYWDIRSSEHDLQRARIYAQLLDVGVAIVNSKIEAHRAIAQLGDIETIIQQDEELRDEKHKTLMELARAATSNAKFSSIEADRKVELAGSDGASAHKKKQEMLRKINREYGLAIQEVDSDTSFPISEREAMKEMFRAVYRQACKDLGVEIPTAPVEPAAKGQASRQSKVDQAASRMNKCEVDISIIRNDPSRDDVEKRKIISMLRADAEADCKRIMEE